MNSINFLCGCGENVVANVPCVVKTIKDGNDVTMHNQVSEAECEECGQRHIVQMTSLFQCWCAYDG